MIHGRNQYVQDQLFFIRGNTTHFMQPGSSTEILPVNRLQKHQMEFGVSSMSNSVMPLALMEYISKSSSPIRSIHPHLATANETLEIQKYSLTIMVSSICLLPVN